MLMALCLSSCSDDDALLPDDFENGPDINVVNQGQVMFLDGKWVDAKTDFTEEELREALMSHGWHYSTGDPSFFYDKKHFSTDSLWNFDPDEVVPDGSLNVYWYFINDSVAIEDETSKPDMDFLNALAKDPVGHYIYDIRGNQIIITAPWNSSYPAEMFPITYNVVGFNSKTIFFDTPAKDDDLWRHLKSFKLENTTRRYIWGEVPQ